MTWADLIAALIRSDVDLSRPAMIAVTDRTLVPVERLASVDRRRADIVPASALYTQADLDAARDEAYEQGVVDAKAGVEHLEPALEGGVR